MLSYSLQPPRDRDRDRDRDSGRSETKSEYKSDRSDRSDRVETKIDRGDLPQKDKMAEIEIVSISLILPAPAAYPPPRDLYDVT